MRKVFILLSITLFFPLTALWAQQIKISGRILNAVSGNPVPGVLISVTHTDIQTISDENGYFSMEIIANNAAQLLISSSGFESITKTIQVGQREDIVLGDIFLYPLDEVFGELPTIEVMDTESEDDFGQQHIVSLQGASDDIYLSGAAYKFGSMRFRVRGFDSRYTETYINGINFNDPIRGMFNYSMIGGLNDVTRNKDITLGLEASRYGFGDIGGTNNIITNAASYGQGGKITASLTNRTYRYRGIASYSTGLMANNLAVTGAIGFRYADEGYVEGTSYNSFGYFLSVEKYFGERNQHSLSLVTFGAPNRRGRQGASFQEAYDLTNNNYYNPYWGYQNGEKRNSRVATSFDPALVISHRWQINEHSELTTGLGARYNQYGTTALNWYNSADPRPDYYRYLPSWQSTDEMKALYTQAWENDPSVSQIDWDRLYEVNYGRDRALYMVEERHNDLLEGIFNSVFRTDINEQLTLSAGIEFKTSKGMTYKTVDDLLGSQYWLDVDQFAERDFPGDPDKVQNDLNNPNRMVTEGDVFGYDYEIYVNSGKLWLQNEFSFPRTDFYYAAKLSYTSFYRYGNMKNGRAPDNSYGKGSVHDFWDYAFKAGGLFKITGRHMVSLNALYQTQAPLPYDAYLSARTKDDVLPGLSSEKILSADVSYLISTPLINGRATLFQTNFYDQNELNSFYHDSYRTFVNYAMTNIEKVHHGLELGVAIDLTSQITLEAVGTIAEYQYKNRPDGYVTYENGSQDDVMETVYLKNFYVGGTPQTAGSIGLSYFHPRYWFFDINYNYFDRNYVDLSPVRRTESAVAFQAMSQEERDEKVAAIVEQEKYDAGGTLDVSIGKSIRLRGGYSMSINLSINNVLDNTDLKSGGYEQGRFDFDTYDINKFPSRYYYAQGINYFLNVNFRF
ncbi:TonB-dependent receptor [Thermophagus xiamenensis]|uniref:TonB-dependent Receptor Plug Domain n=1 Tax=Thermophagus xiamenensis TaxID=385682 RepID=A0A1I1W4Y6_9BACT|nr:TonB-dependent receptor [Thermophagus xiamenensis]SFD88393.1 TonB-dependent Receptor Plug Domain [Thermophagus xiamenensis]